MKVPRAGIPNRDCAACGVVTPTGPDACLGVLPGVSHACCGHGDRARAYVVLGGEQDQRLTEIECKLTLRGQMALDFFTLVRAGRANPVWPGDA